MAPRNGERVERHLRSPQSVQPKRQQLLQEEKEEEEGEEREGTTILLQAQVREVVVGKVLVKLVQASEVYAHELPPAHCIRPCLDRMVCLVSGPPVLVDPHWMKRWSSARR